MHLVPLPVVIPLLIAAILAAVGNIIPRRLMDLIATLTVAAVAAICIVLTLRSSHGTLVYWFGNWKPDPQSRFPIGVCFAVDPIGAGMASLVSVLMLAAITVSWTFFETIKSFYHTLMLVFLAAMCGLCLTGDIFNMFVWLELMTAVGVGLCGYESESGPPLLGALNFAVLNTIGAFVTLMGITLLYAQYGALNMAELGKSLAMHNPGSKFVCVAFLLLISGFLVKSAAAPFHFWLADAHAVAPTPVCILFSGVMVELGIYAVARIYWTIFAGSFGDHGEAVQTVLLVMGGLTAIVGAVHCFGQRHFKRMLALSTISHVGLMLLGLAMLRADALAGLALYVVGHGLIKGALFITSGILLHRYGTVDEHQLRGRGKSVGLACLLVIAAVGLAGLPPFATFYGQDFIDTSAKHVHLEWVTFVPLVAEVLTTAAILRFTARVFLEWGVVREASVRGAPVIAMKSETAGGHDKIPLTMSVPALALLLLAIGLGVSTQARAFINLHAARFVSASGYQSVVLEGRANGVASSEAPEATLVSWRQGVVVLGSVAFALIALFPHALGPRLNRVSGRAVIAFYKPLRRLQSGIVGDYVAWFIAGIAFYGGILLLWRG